MCTLPPRKGVIVPTLQGDQFTPVSVGWMHKEYMRRMDIIDATPKNLAMPEEAVGPSTKLSTVQPAPANPQPSPIATADPEPVAPEAPTTAAQQSASAQPSAIT
ncbi:hypothetical protein V6N13_142087 [Hibiscus sabdariffa]|uniref:Uncharacterized protein n=1 Tax=Hibiscus sabdariffa TaxID=183260 RepID=A0ABR2FD35_9ROSI